MLGNKIIRLLSAAAPIGMIIWIFLNPITYGTGDLTKLTLISTGINEIMRGIGLSLELSPAKTIEFIFFTEYFIFGLTLMITTKIFCEKTLKNIFFPLFTGLFTSVILVYDKYKNYGISYGIDSIMVMFEGVVIGILLFLLIDFVSSGFSLKKSSGKSKYRKGR